MCTNSGTRAAQTTQVLVSQLLKCDTAIASTGSSSLHIENIAIRKLRKLFPAPRVIRIRKFLYYYDGIWYPSLYYFIHAWVAARENSTIRYSTRVIHYSLFDNEDAEVYCKSGNFVINCSRSKRTNSRPAHKQLMMEHPPMQSLVHHPSLYGIQPKSSRSVCSSSSSSSLASFIMLSIR